MTVRNKMTCRLGLIRPRVTPQSVAFSLFCMLPPTAIGGDLFGFMLLATCGAISSEYEAKVSAQIEVWRSADPELDLRLEDFSLTDLLAKKEVQQMYAGLSDEEMREAKHHCDAEMAAVTEGLKQQREPSASSE